jgi:restriction system protein
VDQFFQRLMLAGFGLLLLGFLLVQAVNATHGLILLVPVAVGAGSIWWYREQQKAALRLRAAAVASARSLDGLLQVTPTEFELLVRDILNAQGFNLRHQGGSGDRGIDLVGTRPDGVPVIVQCKQYALNRKITGPDIRSFLGAMSQHSIARGLYVTTCTFTQEAQVAAKAGGVTIVDGQRLTRLASRVTP